MSRPRTAVSAALLTVAIVAIAWVVFRLAVYERPATPTAPPPPAAAPAPTAPLPEPARAAQEPLEVSVLQVAGTVEKSAAGGPWARIAAGDRLRKDDALRTSRSGRAELTVGDRARLTVTEASQVDVRELSEAVHRFRLTRGRIAARYEKDGSRVLRVEGADGETAAESEGASFSVLASGLSLAVATETGTVQLRSAGAAVQVDAGKQAVALTGQAPAAPTAIPLEVLLKVADASRVGTADLCAAIEGRVHAGAAVTVDGEPAEVSADGRFAMRVRRRGRDAVVVETREPDGKTARRTVPCREALPDTVTDFNVRWKDDSAL